ncbi:hypothetical protein [Ornithinibacillus xuwenensis]|uniref:ATPase n=1 Tax=Ornithinibacillus xuwenensis TaxID=3144668 RepID=A0ABU9XK98_9BACI
MPSKIGYYVSGNTAEGFVNFLPTNTTNFFHHIILKHPSHTLKSAIIQEIIHEYEPTNDIEVLYSSIGKEFLDGVIIRDKKVAIIDERIATAALNGAFEINLSLFTKDEILSFESTDAITNIENYTQQAYEDFWKGLKVHDDLEEIYIKEMDFDRANEMADEYIQKVLKDTPNGKQDPAVFHRFFGTNTKDGVVNVVPTLLNGLTSKYFIKGRAGTGKSTFMKKIMAACNEHGYDVELYHCSFDPNSIDMVLVRDLDFCVFDSTDPHEYFPEKPGEEIIDMYKEAVTSGTDEKYATDIKRLNLDYKSFMKKGVQQLQLAGEALIALEQQVLIDPKEVEKIKSFILNKIIE